MRARTPWFWLLLAACGGGGDPVDPPDAFIVDPMIDARVQVDAPATSVVELWTFGVEYLRYRDGDGPWVEPFEISADTYALRVTDDYQVIGGCDDGPAFDVSMLSATAADDDLQFMFCFVRGTTTTPPTLHQVTAQMQQAGSVQLYDYAASATGPWDVALDVRAGTHDLVALGNDRILLQRDISVSANQVLPGIDVDADGVALDVVPLTINTVEAGETVRSEINLYLDNSYPEIPGTATTALAPPASLLTSNDSMYLDVIASTSNTIRSGSADFTGTETTFNLLPPLSGLTFAEQDGVLEVSWGSLPSYTEMALSLYGDYQYVRVTATKSWLDATGATSIGFTEMPPGWNTAWSLDLQAPYSRYVNVSSNVGVTWYSTSWYETVNGAVATPPPRRPPLQRQASATGKRPRVVARLR